MINMMQMKVYICCKTSSNRIRFGKSAFKNQKPKADYLTGWGDHSKTMKVIKVLRVKCAPVTGISRRIVMDHNNRCLLVRPIETITQY